MHLGVLKDTDLRAAAVLLSAAICTNSIAYAQANEGVFTVSKTIFAAPSGIGAKNGRTQSDATGLQEAIDSAKGIDSKIILLDGVYRQKYDVTSGSSVLILEAQNSGGAVISGSDRFTNWTGPDATGVWQAPWTLKWGTGEPTAPQTYMKRREMVFVDNARMTQRVDPIDATKPVSPSLLENSEFTVDETAGRMYLKPPSGKNPNSAVTEASVRGQQQSSTPGQEARSYPLLSVSDHGKIKIKGIVFRHSASRQHDPGVLNIVSNGKTQVDFPRDVLVEDCDFVDNNGVGFVESCIRGMTVRNCRFNDNGERGAGLFWTRRVLYEQCEFSRNNWRYDGYLSGWDAAGIKIFDGQRADSWFVTHSDSIEFLRCKFIGNSSHGLWNDYGAKNLRVISCLFEGNKYAGEFQEVTSGPLLVKNCVYRRNGWANQDNSAFLVVNSPDITIDSCIMYQNGPSSNIYSNSHFDIIGDNRVDPDAGDNKPVRMTITNSTIQASRPGDNLFKFLEWDADGNVAKHTWRARAAFSSSLRSDYNRWFRADAPNLDSWLEPWKNGKLAFGSDATTVYGDYRDSFGDLTWEQWLTKEYIGAGTRQDQHSSWVQVSEADLDKLDPTLLKPTLLARKTVPMANHLARQLPAQLISLTGRYIPVAKTARSIVIVRSSEGNVLHVRASDISRDSGRSVRIGVGHQSKN